MNTRTCRREASWLLASIVFASVAIRGAELESGPPTAPERTGLGRKAHYRVEAQTTPGKSTVTAFDLSLGPKARASGQIQQWLMLEATKQNGDRFRVWVLGPGYPPSALAEARDSIERYVLQEGGERAQEFRDRLSRRAVLPSLGGWAYLFPRGETNGAETSDRSFAPMVLYLGHRYVLDGVTEETLTPPPPDRRIVDLLPDLWVGAASNTRQRDEGRRYDNSDYPLVRLQRADYREMFEAGLNCFKVEAEQLPWVQELDAFYWGIAGADLPYPECLYRSTYLGPTLFLDEPAVCTRDYVIRPRLSREPSFRKSVSPETAFGLFRDYFQQAVDTGAPRVLFQSLVSRPDVDPGTMKFMQANLFSWETMVSTAGYQLTREPTVPSAMVFEPPGRVGALRTLPEMDMTYGCQLPVNDPKNLTSILYGFLRGAARLSGKSWGTSIYGGVDRADAFWFLTHAYDLGATRFFFWDNGPQSCVPYHECLDLARNLQAHAANYPDRDLRRLTRAAEVAILLPPGYNLGHVQMGKGSLWGLGEMNLERTNRAGVKYRVVMSNFFAEIERCLRLGIEFDLLWDLPDRQPLGYREIIHVREDGRVGISTPRGERTLRTPRRPTRPEGEPPGFRVELSVSSGKAPLRVRVQGEVTETAARVWYTHGTDRDGVCHNAYVAWELYGPSEEDYRSLIPQGSRPEVTRKGVDIDVATEFTLNRPGTYRLRAATVDLAGRSTVVWKSIVVSE
jgi:hypothetical protein